MSYPTNTNVRSVAISDERSTQRRTEVTRLSSYASKIVSLDAHWYKPPREHEGPMLYRKDRENKYEKTLGFKPFDASSYCFGVRHCEYYHSWKTDSDGGIDPSTDILASSNGSGLDSWYW